MNLVVKIVVFFSFCISVFSASNKTFLVGFPQDDMNNQWRKAQVLEVEKELLRHKNIDFIYSDAQGRTSKLVADIEKMVDKGIDLLIISPKNKKALTPIIDKIYKSGIRVVLLTRSINSENYDSFIAPSDYKIAQEAAKTIYEKRGGKAKILMLEGIPTTSTAVARKDGFLAEIAKHPNMKVVASKVAHYKKSLAMKATEEAIKEGADFDTIYAHSDSMADGARTVLLKNSIDIQKIDIVGIDYVKSAQKAIKDGEQLATFTYPTCGKEGALTAARILNGGRVKKNIEIKSVKVTKENVASVQTIF